MPTVTGQRALAYGFLHRPTVWPFALADLLDATAIGITRRLHRGTNVR